MNILLGKTYTDIMVRRQLHSMDTVRFLPRSTNMLEERRRSENIEIKEIHYYPATQNRFFINECHKSQFIDLTSRFLSEDQRNVINWAGEADTAIVETTISQVTTPLDSGGSRK